MPKYKPGQFVKVDIPGKYRVNKVLNAIEACAECDIRRECYSPGLSPFLRRSCTETIGMCANIKKVK